MPWPGIDVTACPFCSAVSQTLDEEIRSMDVAVFAELLLAAKINDEIAARRSAAEPLPSHRTSERQTADLPSATKSRCRIFGPDDKSQVYMLMAAEGPELFWGTPLVLTAKGADYIRQLIQLPDDPSRLPFFWNYLEASGRNALARCVRRVRQGPVRGHCRHSRRDGPPRIAPLDPGRRCVGGAPTIVSDDAGHLWQSGRRRGPGGAHSFR